MKNNKKEKEKEIIKQNKKKDEKRRKNGIKMKNRHNNMDHYLDWSPYKM